MDYCCIISSFRVILLVFYPCDFITFINFATFIANVLVIAIIYVTLP